MIGRSQGGHFVIERRSLIEWSAAHKASTRWSSLWLLKITVI